MEVNSMPKKSNKSIRAEMLKRRERTAKAKAKDDAERRKGIQKAIKKATKKPK